MIIQQKVVMLMDSDIMMVKFTMEQEGRQKKFKNPLPLLNTDQKDLIVQIYQVDRTIMKMLDILIDVNPL